MAHQMAEDFEAGLRRALAAHTPQKMTEPGARPAAVLIPVVGGPDPSVIFTVRTDHLPSHKGQIAFPGGSIDDTDPDATAAALRESEEEIGLDPALVDVVGELDTFPTFVSGYLVTPIVGYLAEPPELRPNPAEVAEVLEVPLGALTEEIRAEPGFSHDGKTYPTEAWVYEDRVIWGVTARILRGFLGVLANEGLVDAPKETGSWTGWPIPTP